MTKKPRVDAKDKFKKKKKKEEKKRILNYIMSIGIFGQTSCGKKCYKDYRVSKISYPSNKDLAKLLW